MGRWHGFRPPSAVVEVAVLASAVIPSAARFVPPAVLILLAVYLGRHFVGMHLAVPAVLTDDSNYASADANADADDGNYAGNDSTDDTPTSALATAPTSAQPTPSTKGDQPLDRGRLAPLL